MLRIALISQGDSYHGIINENHIIMVNCYSVFHGTSLCEDDMPYERPRHDVSIFDASFYAANIMLAKDFAMSDSEIPVLPIILLGEQNLETPYIIRGHRDIYAEFGISDADPLEMRQRLFSELRKDHDGIIYHDKKDEPFEIVAFREDTFHLKGVKVHSGNGWSQSVDFQQLERIFDTWKSRLDMEISSFRP